MSRGIYLRTEYHRQRISDGGKGVKHKYSPRPDVAIRNKNNIKDDACNWKGDSAKYSALHRRVEIQRGKPKFCEICKTIDKRKKYHWANLTGNYADIMDYKRMCEPCHKNYDIKKARQKNGKRN